MSYLKMDKLKSEIEKLEDRIHLMLKTKDVVLIIRSGFPDEKTLFLNHSNPLLHKILAQIIADDTDKLLRLQTELLELSPRT